MTKTKYSLLAYVLTYTVVFNGSELNKTNLKFAEK